jgi:hypothetical protein
MTLPIRRYLPQPSLEIVLKLNTIKWAVVCFTLPMDDGYCVRESLEVDNCGHSVAFRDLITFLSSSYHFLHIRFRMLITPRSYHFPFPSFPFKYLSVQRH